jgi:hypothetical protein
LFLSGVVTIQSLADEDRLTATLLPSSRIEMAQAGKNQLDPLPRRNGFRLQRTARKSLHAQLLATTLRKLSINNFPISRSNVVRIQGAARGA